MKSVLLVVSVLLVASFSIASGAERKAMSEVSQSELLRELQIGLDADEGRHISIVWWIPEEYWECVGANQSDVGADHIDSFLDMLTGVSVVTIAQADISMLGAFSFYSREEIQGGLAMRYTDRAGNKHPLTPLREISPNLDMMFKMLGPVLEGGMGPAGRAMEFFVVETQGPDMEPILDPYEHGQLTVELTSRSGAQMTAEIETPLNALHVPRICPNGKEAHVSWRFCPWTGQRLDD